MRQWFIETVWAWFRDRAYYLVTAFAVIKISTGYLVHKAGVWIDPAIRHSLAWLPQFKVSTLVVVAQLIVLVFGLAKLYRSKLPRRWSIPAIAGWLGLLGVVLLSGWFLVIAFVMFLAGAVYHWRKT